MSSREKRLLIFFATAGFIVLNFLAFNYYRAQKTLALQGLNDARVKLESAQQFSASREQVSAEMEWLNTHQPATAENQDVQTKLQQFCETEAKTQNLIIKSQKPLPSDTREELNYHRAKIEITVNGSEESLYRWFDRINIPEQMRIATRIRILPNVQDDTKIDCTTTIEQWFTPLPPST